MNDEEMTTWQHVSAPTVAEHSFTRWDGGPTPSHSGRPPLSAREARAMRRPSDITKYEHESYVREAKRERNRYLSHSRRKARYYGHVHNAVYFGTRLSIFGVLPSFLLTMASIWWPGTPIEVWYSARAWMTVTAVFAIPFLYYLFWMTRFSRNRELNWDEDVIQNFIDEYLQAEIDAYEPKDAT